MEKRKKGTWRGEDQHPASCISSRAVIAVNCKQTADMTSADAANHNAARKADTFKPGRYFQQLHIINSCSQKWEGVG